MPRPAPWCLLLVLTVAAGAAGQTARGTGAAAAAGTAPIQRPLLGLPLAEALRRVQGPDLKIVFTSLLVPPALRVVAEPTAVEPRQVLDELLRPHGLAAREETPGVLVVVKASSPLPAGEPTSAGPAAAALPVVREEILVRPSVISLLDESAEVPGFTFDRDEIERLPHLADDVFRAASLLPGIATTDVSAQLSVRGGRPDEVKVVLDGQELYGAYHLQDYDNAMSLVPARLLASASLTTGALPASQGDRMSGVLDLRTLDPSTGHQLTLGISALDALAASAGTSENGSIGWLFTARRGSLDLARRAIGDENPHFWDVLGKAEWTTRHGRLAGHLLVTGDALAFDVVEEEDFEKLHNEYRSDYLWFTYESGNERLLVRSALSGARLTQDRGGETREEKGAFGLRDERRLDAWSLSQTVTQPGATHNLEWGWEARRYDVSFDHTQQRAPDIVLLGRYAADRPSELRVRSALRSDHYGLWGRDVRSVGERVLLETGLRYDHHTTPSEDLWSPRLSLGWRLSDRALLRLAWGRFHQSHRPYELAIGDGETRRERAERSDQWVLGLEAHPRPRLRLATVRLELYHRAVDRPRPRHESLLEPVNFFPETEPDRGRVAPQESTERGLELLVRGARGERGGWWLAYSRATSEDHLDGHNVPRALDQPHNGAIAVDWRLPREWQLAVAWRWHSGWPTTRVTPVIPPEDPEDPEEPEEPDEPGESEDPALGLYGPLRGERFPAYHRLDLRLSRRWQTRRGNLIVFLDVQNLYDRRNQSGFDVALDDDTGLVRLLREDWPGIVPSLGLTWQLGG